MVDSALDAAIRRAAFDHLRALSAGRDYVTSEELARGFEFNGERIPLVNPRRGIFKPRQMKYLLSIRTVFPKPGNRVWYDDQRSVHQALYQSEEFVDYAFMGDNPESADNRWLREASEDHTPIVYFIGVAPGRFFPACPSYLAGWDKQRLIAKVGFGEPADYLTAKFGDNSPARKYALRVIKQRMHQATFREAVMSAYAVRCAISGLPEPKLLDAAHIVEDRHESLGQPIVRNGLPLSKVHHAAFDAHLIGIDMDFKIHIAPQLLAQKDGPILEAIKSVNGQQIRLPARKADFPDRDRLEMRFLKFKAAALNSN
jgi:putative restriction endonuclease